MANSKHLSINNKFSTFLNLPIPKQTLEQLIPLKALYSKVFDATKQDPQKFITNVSNTL